MPYVNDLKFSDGTVIHRWSSYESLADLQQMCNLRGISVRDLVNVRSTRRKAELMVERIMLNIIFGPSAELRHLPSGQPYVTTSDAHISITHTVGMVCVAVNEHHRIGVDVENLNNRVLNVRTKFLSEHEQQFIDPENVQYNLVAWTAKEALYKVIDQPGMNFRDDLQISNPSYTEDCTLTLTARYGPERTFISKSVFFHGMIVTLAYEVDNEEDQNAI